jgi:soluble lytic murein transglycosylase-like protein
MRSTRKATPLHIFVMATILVTAGGISRMNQNLPYAESLAKAVYRIIPSLPQAQEEEQEDEQTAQAQHPDNGEQGGAQAPAAPVKRETLAQKRARYAPHIEAASDVSNVPAALIEAVITAESAFNPLAVSRTGAVGLMQLMPATAARFGVKDRTDPAQNILGGAKYLDFLLNKFKKNKKLAIAAYNAGEGNVKKHGNKIPPFKETRKYVPKVLSFYKKYRDDDL